MNLVFLLAITSHYSQCPRGREPIDAGPLLAHNGKVAVYSQYFLRVFWVFANELAGCIVGEPVAKVFPHLLKHLVGQAQQGQQV